MDWNAIATIGTAIVANLGALIAVAMRIERRLTRIEVNLKWLIAEIRPKALG